MSLFITIVRDVISVLLFVVDRVHLLEYEQDPFVKPGPEGWLLHVGGELELSKPNTALSVHTI